MSDLFNYRNTNLIGSVIEGYEYNSSTGETNTIAKVFYVIDKTQLLLTGKTVKTQVYVTVLIDPTYTTYTSIETSNLDLTSIAYIATESIIDVKEFPKTTPLISMENGLVGANIKGYEYNVATGQSNTVETTCKIIDKMEILVSDILTQVYVCVLYSGTTGSDKLYVPFTSVTEVVSFGIIDYGRPSVLRYTGMNFKQDAGLTSVLFKDITSGNILRVEPINTIQAVNTAPSTDIVIQRTGGEEIIIQGLELAVTQINGVVAGATIAAAVIALNALFAHAGSVGSAPTITSSTSLSLTLGQVLNYELTGTNIVSVVWTNLPTGIAPVIGNIFKIIGGSALSAGTYNFTVEAINYYGSVTASISLSISASYTNTKSFNPGSGSNAYFQKTAVGVENNTPLYRAAGNTGPAWSVFGWLKNNAASTAWKPVFYFGDYSSGAGGTNLGRVRFHNRISTTWPYNTIELYFSYGLATYPDVNLIKFSGLAAGVSKNTWFSFMVVYDGGNTNTGSATSSNPFSIYINGVQLSPSWTVVGGGYGGSIEYISGFDKSQVNIARGEATGVTKYANVTFFDEMALWQSDESSNVATFHNSGTPIDLTSYNPYAYYRFGDAPTDISGYPIMEDVGTTGTDLTAYNGTVADYVSDVP
jgi:hypothetical protein